MINGDCSNFILRDRITEADVVRYIACIVRRQALYCAERGLHCIDVPCFSSSVVMIDRQDRYSKIRKIWKIIKKFLVNNEKRIRIYDDDDLLRVDLYIVLKKGTLYLDKSETYMLDEYDSKNVQCVQITNAYKLYTYLEARLEEGNLIRINVIYLLKKLVEAGHIDLLDSLINTLLLIYDIKSGNFNKIADLYLNMNNIVSKLSYFKDVLKDVLPEAHSSQLLDKLKRKIKPLCDILMSGL